MGDELLGKLCGFEVVLGDARDLAFVTINNFLVQDVFVLEDVRLSSLSNGYLNYFLWHLSNSYPRIWSTTSGSSCFWAFREKSERDLKSLCIGSWLRGVELRVFYNLVKLVFALLTAKVNWFNLA